MPSVLLLLATVGLTLGAAGGGDVATYLVVEPGGPAVSLKVLLANRGARLDADGVVRLRLHRGEDVVGTVEAPVACRAWRPDQVEVVRLAAWPWPADAGDELAVTGELVGQPEVRLGVLHRQAGQVRFERAPPPDAVADEVPCEAVAACHFLDAERFEVRVAFLNCGARFDRDYDAFLHFEPEATGENLTVTSQLGLGPRGEATDSSTWGLDTVTVVTFGPYTVPTERQEPIYLRVGLYDRAGDGHRVRLVGAGEADRVLVGRLVHNTDGWAFERSEAGR